MTTTEQEKGAGRPRGSKNRARPNRDWAEIDALRAQLRALYEEAEKSGRSLGLFDAIGSPKTVKIWAKISPGNDGKPRPSSAFRPQDVAHLRAFLKLMGNKPLYAALADKIGQTRTDFAALTDYVGKYIFFRYRPEEGGRVYAPGTIQISWSEGDEMVEFQQWSENYVRTRHRGRAEHTGYVFYHDSKLYFAGRRHGVMRLGIVETPKEFKRSEWRMPGVILSVGTQRGEPFAAKLLLVPVQNKEVFQRLKKNRDDDGGEIAFLKEVRISEAAKCATGESPYLHATIDRS